MNTLRRRAIFLTLFLVALLGGLAQPTLANTALCDQLVNQLITVAKTDAKIADDALKTLATIERDFPPETLDAVDGLLKQTTDETRKSAVEQLLAKQPADQAAQIFGTAARLSDEAKQGILQASTLARVEGVDAGTSIFRISNVKKLSDQGKEATFVAIKNLKEVLPPGTGLDEMLKKTGEQLISNYGGVYELQAAEWARQQGTYGRVTSVGVDAVDGTLDKIDILTERAALQVKSKVDPGDILKLTDINGGETALEAFVTQSGTRTPLFISSNALADDLTQAIGRVNAREGFSKIVVLAPGEVGGVPPVFLQR